MRLPSTLAPLRGDAWWEHKLSPILATMYATAAQAHSPWRPLLAAAALATAALAVCASYVSVLNDLTDAADDRASGKPNRWAGTPRGPATLVLVVCAAAGAAFVWTWRDDVLLLAAYAGCWLAFTLYSVPPVRLKVRGLCGVLADASGAHLSTTLFGVFLVGRWTHTAAPLPWTAVVGLWAFAAGMRGILRHQIGDLSRDRAAGLRTFAAIHGGDVAARLGTAAFVVECVSFAALLWLSRGVAAAALLAAYGAFASIRQRALGIALTIVRPEPGSRTAMEEYYIILYPIAYLAGGAWRDPGLLIVLALHSLLFSRQARYFARELRRLITLAARRGPAASR